MISQTEKGRLLKEQEKLCFKIMSKAVSNNDFKRLKKIALQSLNEQPNAMHWLNQFYSKVNVCFFYETSDKSFGGPLFPCLSSTDRSPLISAMAFYHNQDGYVGFFIKNYRENYQNVVDDEVKILFLEEFIHLINLKRNNIPPFSLVRLQTMYNHKETTVKEIGNYLLAKLRDDRDHFSVHFNILHAYPDIWIKKMSNPQSFCTQPPEQLTREYENWRNDSVNVAHTYLIVNYLTMANWLYIFEEVSKENLSAKNRVLLGQLFLMAKKEIEATYALIEKEMGQSALSLLDSNVTAVVFESADSFFKVILLLWQQLNLV